MLKVYFACSIRGGRDDAAIYSELVMLLKQKAIVLTELFVNNKLTTNGMDRPSEEIWQTDLAWIKDADVVIAEVTNPSLGVGYEIAKAEGLQKPILCLYRPHVGKKLSAMIDGSPQVIVGEYNDITTADKLIDAFLRNVE